MSLKVNVIANYLGQGWKVLMSVAFIPLYLRYLGIEAYGLIGIFAILQAWLALIDMGLKPALGREMARFSGGANDVEGIRDLLRSVEIIGAGIAIAIATGVWAASGWLASDWVRAKSLDVESIAHAFAVMGAVTSLRFVEDIYVSSIVGLQRQVMENAVSSAMATVRGLGAIAVLAWISPTIEAFFAWQLIVSILSTALLSCLVYRVLPPSSRSARFSKPALLGIWRFAAGMAGITLLVLLLTQLDKILLSRLLSLEVFGYYALAGVVVNALSMLAGPISTAFYPRFTELITRQDDRSLRAAYHLSSQLVTVIVGSAAIVMMIFADRFLLLWTGDVNLTLGVAPLVTVLAGGTLINAMLWIPYQIQLAHGWTALAVKGNVIAVLVLVPAILWVVPRFGAIGAAWVWLGLNVGYIAIGMHFMYRRIMSSEKWKWYREDVILPLAGAAASALLLRWIVPSDMGKFSEVAALSIAAICVIATAALVGPEVRRRIVGWLPFKLIRARTKNGCQ